ncbi:hypothetical protein Agub_g1944 [Astrephomene gubernaculifera]|uniref:Uncharacterized protein n=1 Tax=Astrephomene gubernaculifera TaxID=47775 RepID=A0AAD3HH96_9CHLO|nr:hypothetical protein Agub_g1944 [Astrephomene gubernaculifera]
MASTEMPSEAVDPLRHSRQQRVGRYKVWLLQKRLAELSAQVEASVLEARQLIAWKQSYQPLSLAELTDEDKRILEHNRRIRLIEVVQKHCFAALKSITQHKWAFPFNTPVDTSRFPDYPKVITHPMDFSTIKARQDGGYYRDPKDWWADVMLVFSNAKRYNAPGSDCYLMAQTLQEVSEEKYDKVIAPRLAEESAALLRDEIHLKKKRAELLNLQISEAMEAQCGALFNLMAELHAAIREAKSMAASLCEPLTLEEKQALAATIQGLPTAQLESIVAFVASRHPPSVTHSELPPGAAGGGGGGPSRKVQLNLGRYDPLLLRQLQHLVSTCTAATQQQQQASKAAVGADAQGVAPQRAVSPPATTPAEAATEQARPLSGSPSPGPGQEAAGGPGADSAAAPATGSNGGAAAGGTAAQNAAQDLGTGADQQQQQQAVTGAAGQGDPTAGLAAGQATAVAAAVAGGSVVARPASGGGAAPSSAAPVPFSSTQRNISDVVTNATASGISMRAGIKWPGLAVGAGVRPRARALLSMHPDVSATAAEVLAACPLPQPPPQRTTVQVIGVKRRSVHVIQVDADGGHQGAEQRRAAGAPGAPAAAAADSGPIPMEVQLGASRAATEVAAMSEPRLTTAAAADVLDLSAQTVVAGGATGGVPSERAGDGVVGAGGASARGAASEADAGGVVVLDLSRG